MKRIKKIVSANPLFFAFLLPAAVDGTVTLLGQDASYWTNKVVNEGSPAYFFLLASPWLFVLGSILWFVLWFKIIKKLPEPFNLFVMFIFIAGHSWGGGSWIWRMMRLSGIYSVNNQTSVMLAWGVMVFYFVLIAICATYNIRTYFKRT